jgi:hypothetical protein
MVNNSSILLQNISTQTLVFGNVSIPPGQSAPVAWTWAAQDTNVLQALLNGVVQIVGTALDTLDNLGFFVQGQLLNAIEASGPQVQYVFMGAFQTGRLYVQSANGGVTVTGEGTPDGVTWYPLPDWAGLTLSAAGSSSVLLPTGVVMLRLTFTPQSGTTPTITANYTLQSYPSAGY